MASSVADASLSEEQKKHLLETMSDVISDLAPALITASLDSANPFQSKGVVDVNSCDQIFGELIRKRIEAVNKQQPPIADQVKVLKELEDLKAHHSFPANTFKDIINKLPDVMKEATGVQIPSSKFLEELYKFKQQHQKKAAAPSEPKKEDNANQPPQPKPVSPTENQEKQKTVENQPKAPADNQDKAKVVAAPVESQKPPVKVAETNQKQEVPKLPENSQGQPIVPNIQNKDEKTDGQGKDQQPQVLTNKQDQQKNQEHSDVKKTDPAQPLKEEEKNKPARETGEEHLDPKTLPPPNTTKKATVGEIKTGSPDEHQSVQSPKQHQTNSKFDEVKSLLDNLNLKDETALKKQLNDLKGKLALMENHHHETSQMHHEEENNYKDGDYQNHEYSFDQRTPYQDDQKAQSPSPRVKKVKVVDIAKLKEKGIGEIYNFYCKQHLMGVQKMTFEALGQEGQKMLFGDFLKMCQDFQINIKKEQLLEIYRMKVRRHGGQQHLTYQLFLELLSEVFQHLHLEQYDAREEELQQLRGQYDQLMQDNPDIIDNKIEAQKEFDQKAFLEQSIQELEQAQEVSLKCGSSKKKSWRGHLNDDQNEIEVYIDHLNFNKNRVEGSGQDERGEFSVSGTYQMSSGSIEFLRQYPEDKQNITQFTGKYDTSNNSIEGTWKLKGGQQSGQFFLKRDLEHQSQTKELFAYFLEKAHQHLQTSNKAYYIPKMKGFHRAFGGMNDFSDPKLMDKLKKNAPHLNYGGKNVIPEQFKSNKSAILEKSLSHRKNDSNVSNKLAPNVKTTGNNLYQDETEVVQQHLKLRQLSVKSQQQQQLQQTPDSGSQQAAGQQYHIKERLNSQLRKQEKQNRDWIKEQALARIRNGQARIGGGMRDYSSEENHHQVPRSQGNNGQPISIEQQNQDDNENISIEPSSPKDSLKKVNNRGGQHSVRTSVQKTQKNLTLEQLRNIPNPKELFTKRDREQFALLLGLSEDDFPASPQNGNKSPKNANNGQKQQKANNVGIRNRNISVTQKSMDGASTSLKRHPSVQKGAQAPQQQAAVASHKNRGEYVDQRSMEYHQKIMNRANEIEMKSKRQREVANNSQLHPHLIKDSSKDLLSQKKGGKHHRGQSDIGNYPQNPQQNRNQLPQQQVAVRHSSVIRKSVDKQGKSPRQQQQLQKVDSNKRVGGGRNSISPQNNPVQHVRQSGGSPKTHHQQQQQVHQSPNKKGQAILPGTKKPGQIGGPAQNIMMQQQQEQLRLMQQQLSILKNQQKRFY